MAQHFVQQITGDAVSHPLKWKYLTGINSLHAYHVNEPSSCKTHSHHELSVWDRQTCASATQNILEEGLEVTEF